MQSRRSKLQVQELEKKNANTRTNIVGITALIVFALIIGSGLMVYNADDWYIQDQTNLTLLTNTNLEQGGGSDRPVVVDPQIVLSCGVILEYIRSIPRVRSAEIGINVACVN